MNIDNQQREKIAPQNKESTVKKILTYAGGIAFFVGGGLLLLSQLFLCFLSIEIIPSPWGYVLFGAIALTWVLRFDIINTLLIMLGVYIAVVYKFGFPWYVGILVNCPYVGWIAYIVVLVMIFNSL